MPFPWKKVKTTRISQLVNDHLHHSQRRRDGSSLVVETGFPTSLVDLFMKNREKLKKSSKKKRQTPPIAPVCDVDDSVIDDSSTLNVNPPLISPTPSRSSSILPLPLPCKGVNEIRDVGSSDGGVSVGGDERGRGGINSNGVLLVILKMILVVILALGTDRLTIGITVSAFLLFFLDYAGKRVCLLLKPCAETKLVLMLQRVWRLLRFKEDELDGENCRALMPETQKNESLNRGSFSLEKSGSGCRIREYQHPEPQIYLLTRVEEIQSENELIGCSNFIESLEIQETELKKVVMGKEESFCGVVGSQSKKSKKSKIKSKIKKFVPKNLRKSRKEQGPEKLQVVSVDNVALPEEQEVDQWEIESCSGLSSVSSGRYKKEDCTSAVCAISAVSEVDEKAATNRESEISKAGQNWIYFVICLIVLIGLIKGRLFALLLTVSSCLLLKIARLLSGSFRLYRMFNLLLSGTVSRGVVS
ncbi:hypothetical protein BUALT_Bualt03G0016500 [Buddleja alternifolia]|uniref:Ethylene-responsive nuclear protein n=1 Tax=Buddleja alternifolia TaxID=168488 RepID=A0AAV6XRQ0_9LAMI|nr:hypothetical protein BUALT_Bualt03G0016500 [Buddleja alternifolia]